MKIFPIIKKIILLISFTIPFIAYFLPESKPILWDISLYSVFLLMCIRPLNDIFPNLKLGRFISIRKELGILSSIIVVSFGIIHYINIGTEFFNLYFSLEYWSFENNLFWAHLGELTGFILLITSNKYSMRLLKRNWKRIQRLSYVYFFSGAWYVFVQFEKTFGIIAIIIVFELTLIAYIKKRLIFNENDGKISWKW